MTQKNPLVRTSLLLLPLQIVLRGGEALMPVLLAAWFGRSRDTDFAMLALAASALVGSLVFQSFQDGSLVPIVLETKTHEPSRVARLRGALVAYNAAIGAGLALLLLGGGLLAAALVDHGASFALATRMLPLLALQLALLGQRTLQVTLLHTERRFYATPVISFVGIVVNLTTVAWLHERWGVATIALGLAVGEACALGAAWIATHLVYPIEFHYSFERSAPLRKFWRLVSAEVGGSAITRVNPLADQLVAAFAGVAGGGTLLRYSNDVATVPTSLLHATLLPVLVAHLSHVRHAGQRPSVRLFRKTVRRTLAWVVLLLCAASVLLYAIRLPLLQLAFLRGAMDALGVQTMADVLPYHLLGLPSFGVLLVLARAHVSLQNSSILVRLGIFNASCNLLLNAMLVGPLGLRGVALATSITHTAVAVVFAWLLTRKLRELGRTLWVPA